MISCRFECYKRVGYDFYLNPKNLGRDSLLEHEHIRRRFENHDIPQRGGGSVLIFDPDFPRPILMTPDSRVADAWEKILKDAGYRRE